MMLTKPERNRIYRSITESDLDPGQCKLTVTDDRAEIFHVSGSTFEISLMRKRRNDPRYEISAKVVDGRSRFYNVIGTFYYVLEPLQDWTKEVKLVTESPDYWAEMSRSRELIADLEQGDTGNAPFTQNEQRQIAAHLQEVKKQVKEQLALSNEQMERIEERLDEAAEASKRMGRKDWLLLFSGTIFTVIVTDIVTPGVAEHIFTMVINSLGHLFTGGSKPPQILA